MESKLGSRKVHLKVHLTPCLVQREEYSTLKSNHVGCGEAFLKANSKKTIFILFKSLIHNIIGRCVVLSNFVFASDISENFGGL